MKPSNLRAYLGDGLYAQYENGQIKLMANSADHPTDTVYLIWRVVEEFENFVANVRAALDEETKSE